MEFLLNLISGVSAISIVISIIITISPLIIINQLHTITKILREAEENKYEQHRELMLFLIEQKKNKETQEPQENKEFDKDRARELIKALSEEENIHD